MTTATVVETHAPNNRRAYFRINDRIGLRVNVLNEIQFRVARERAAHKHQRQHLLNDIIVSSESRRSMLRRIHEESAEIADYLAQMDSKIDVIANILTQDDSDAPKEPTHNVNLSASGIRFYSDEGYPQGARLELHVHLFPSDSCLRLYGTVTWCQRGQNRGRCAGRMVVAVDYADTPNEDQEILFRHINTLQLDYVRRGVRPSSD